MLTHFQDGSPHMVDVSNKHATFREAVAESLVLLPEAARKALETNPKGDPIAIAELAGIMAAKQTSNLIPLCHPLPLSKVSVKANRIQTGKKINTYLGSVEFSPVRLDTTDLSPTDSGLADGVSPDHQPTAPKDLVENSFTEAVRFTATCKVNASTGVEMEALTAASVAALTLYDMLKSAAKNIVIAEVRLVSKAGGRSGTWHILPEH
jgi:cyclic pyranopterin phosphate synthase